MLQFTLLLVTRIVPSRLYSICMITLIRKQTKTAKNDILSGLTVSLALVPEAVAFAFVAGIDPIVGLYGAFIVGIITSIFGGRPGMISGATGAMAVVMVSLIQEGNKSAWPWKIQSII